MEDTLFDADPSAARRRLPARARAVRARAMRLTDLPVSKQEEIAAAVARQRPPARWLPVGRDFEGDRPLAYLPSRAWYEWHWHRGLDPEAKRTSLPASLRRAVIDRDGMTCGLCREPVEHVADIHIDHIKPVIHGGTDHLSNLQVAHSWCNLSKGARI